MLFNLHLTLTCLFLSQLEDDIVAKPNYFATMKNFAMQLASEDWMILEFSQLGFIGRTMILTMLQSMNFRVCVFIAKAFNWLLHVHTFS